MRQHVTTSLLLPELNGQPERVVVAIATAVATVIAVADRWVRQIGHTKVKLS
jgi:hypothetical protein